MFEPLGRRPRVLVADDETEVRGVLFDLISSSCDCLAVGTAEQALAALRAEQFDLVVSDIMMPGMSGLEMLPEVHEIAPEAVVIMLSGVQSVESALSALRLGAFDYVMKPFDLDHVEAAIGRALEHKALKESKRRYEMHLEEMVARRTAELDCALASLEDAYRTTLQALTAALETRDHETHGHSERVVSFSLRLGRELALSDEELRSLEFGALLHDIGKIGVPDAILRKPAALDSEEWTKMRQHPLHGRKILEGISFLEGAARVVAQHHEQWDGSGYPLGLRGEEIDLNARIFSVADAFDAMTSDRVYRRGRSYELAAEELENFAGRQFDPKVVAAFRRVAPEDWEEMRRRSLEARGGKESAEPRGDAEAVRELMEARIALVVQ